MLPKEKVQAGQSAEVKMLNVIQCCPETPVLGGKHLSPSKSCQDHCEEATCFKPSVTPPELMFFSRHSDSEVQLPDNEDLSLLVGCKKSSNLDRFYNRTAGVFGLVRPCGVIANFTEIFSCEYKLILSYSPHLVDQ